MYTNLGTIKDVKSRENTLIYVINIRDFVLTVSIHVLPVHHCSVRHETPRVCELSSPIRDQGPGTGIIGCIQ
jgi:hypothetical protein